MIIMIANRFPFTSSADIPNFQLDCLALKAKNPINPSPNLLLF